MIALVSLGGIELLLLLLAFVIPVIALIDILRSDFRGSYDKLIWVIVVLCLNTVGALLYALIGRRQRVA
ncbi:PLDc N-terminal domain-containing protein [Larkinella arboricola]|uniref:Phospholipase D-like protein n=1 Tax=Larkinella arboricola TaxID=643671 RepID=A0A327X138_LARAB|nr:PLDc N-terminal domain-containing protein [Larkinella arboricola]RAJ98004.1 phospholipase D-like protein [Larkinella arboricola]